MIMCYNFFVGMCSRCSELIHSKHSAKIEYLKNKYKSNQLWNELKETAKKLKSHNLTYTIKRVKASFKVYFTNLELYKQNPSLF